MRKWRGPTDDDRLRQFVGASETGCYLSAAHIGAPREGAPGALNRVGQAYGSRWRRSAIQGCARRFQGCPAYLFLGGTA